MTVLDEILDASTDSSVPIADLLRKVQIAATRLGASEIAAWARSELSGYGPDDTLPPHRRVHSIVMGLFTGPMQSQITQHLTAGPGMESMWEVDLRQPLVELQSLSEAPGDGDPRIEWPANVVQMYAESGTYRIQYHNLFSAWNVLTKQSLRGVIDVIRTRAMEFALDLQTSFPDAGSLGGPTVESTPALAQTVYNITNNITGHGTNIATGPGAQQTSTVAIGDETALIAKLAELGLGESDRDEFVSALRDDGIDGPRATNFLARIRSGAISLAAGLTTDVAAEVLVSLGRAFLGLTS